MEGSAVRFRSAREARAAGVGMVHQELSVAPDLSVAENVFLGGSPSTASAGSRGAAWRARRPSS